MTTKISENQCLARAAIQSQACGRETLHKVIKERGHTCYISYHFCRVDVNMMRVPSVRQRSLLVYKTLAVLVIHNVIFCQAPVE